MKNNRFITLVISCFILLIGIVYFLWQDESSHYLSLDGLYLGQSKKMGVEEKTIDISGVALGVTDNIDNAAIKKVAIEIERYEVFDGLTMEELTKKLNKSLKGVLSNKGEMIATKCLKLNMDPYMAIAIMLHETGCNYGCSSLARNYYNVGGMKTGSGNYQKFSSIDEGINTFLNNLYGNYYKQGLNTPEKINNKYASSKTWSKQIKKYMETIKNK